MTDTATVADLAVDAAAGVLDRELGLAAPPRHVVAEAIDAAASVFEQAEQERADDVLARTGFGGLDVTDDGLRLRVLHANDFLAAVVSSLDGVFEANGADNYTEWSSTFTDPATRAALDAGAADVPPLRRYTVIVVKPGGKSPHDLRLDAERNLAAIRDAGVDPGLLRWCDWPECLHSYVADPGPAEPGWKRNNKVGLLLCPAHAEAGHWLRIDTYPDPMGVSQFQSTAVLCECGEHADLGQVVLAQVGDWWRGHVKKTPAAT